MAEWLIVDDDGWALEEDVTGDYIEEEALASVDERQPIMYRVMRYFNRKGENDGESS